MNSLPRIIQAPMAGGPTTIDLVVAVSDAGGLGNFGAAYLTPRQIADVCAAAKARTRAPFGVNLFAPLPNPPPSYDPARAVARLRPYFEELDLIEPPLPSLPDPDAALDAQLDAVLAAEVAVVSFTFGLPPERAIARIKARGAYLIGTATTVEEARALERAGCDAVAAQGSEAGGHRGTFEGPFERALIGTMALVPQIADAVRIPVIASGGIMDGRGIAAALALGAVAAQLGTAFLATPESGAPPAQKAALLAAREDETAITYAFSGRAARGIRNRFSEEYEGRTDAIAPYPLQNALTRPLRAAAAAAGKSEYLSMWAGQAPRLARAMPAAELVRALERETLEAIARLR
jgi:nitronate monooxygenase